MAITREVPIEEFTRVEDYLPVLQAVEEVVFTRGGQPVAKMRLPSADASLRRVRPTGGDDTD